MLDPQILRDNPELVAKKLLRRSLKFDAKAYRLLEEERKALQVKTEALQHQRNTQSKLFGQLKAKGEATQHIQAEVINISQELEEKQKSLDALLLKMQHMIEILPNMPHDSVPDGKSEEDNVEVRRYGTIRKFSFTPLPHEDLGENLGQMSFAQASTITGARFVVLNSTLAKLQRALAQWMLDLHTKEHGYQEVYVPYLVNQTSLYGAGQLPKFAEDLFKIDGQYPYYLVPTSEVALINLVREEILDADNLPLRFVCHSPCFRSEAGSYGKDTKGMIRQHQFEKVELVIIAHPEKSYQVLEELTNHAETVLKLLELPYRVVNLCAGDLGNAAKTYDIEVWLPSQGRYREISSCSNLEDFQARRMKIRMRCPTTKKPVLVHTLNGSGLAVGRTLLAIMENYQNKDGSISLPKVIQPYMQGLEKIVFCDKIVKL
ncbi:MAG: serine--tRNA ligase [Legionellales bacterium RIFCSPHIGHO2_12_FULL_37_14]|nr:MAG: serine--tRNA ligase [Legionellales bacterium RIFCSPHIGHO2_12_FULL_37_14]